MIDPRLNDLNYTPEQRDRLVARLGLIPADHPQLWKDSDLARALKRRAEDRASKAVASFVNGFGS